MKHQSTKAALVTLGILAAPALADDTAVKSVLTIEQAVAIALATQPGTVAEAETDQFEGRSVADIEIVNSSGEEIEFKIDLESGEILDVWKDDDPNDDPVEGALEDIAILVPGDLGGGWDTEARLIGGALKRASIVENVVFDNRAGGNGEVGLADMIEGEGALAGALMLNTTQIIARSLNGTYEQSYADLVPVAAPIADFAAFIVHPDSAIQSMEDLLATYDSDTEGFALGGGSAPKGLDHLISALVMEAADKDVGFNYVQFDAPGPAFAALVSGDVNALTTGYKNALALSEQGTVRIIGVTAPEVYPMPKGIPKMLDQEIDLSFVTWTGFFAAPGAPEELVEAYDTAFAELYQTDIWADAVVENSWLEVRADAELFSDHLDEQHEMFEAILEELADK